MTVFGLGNPGKKYEGTLHNAGFEATDRLAAFLGGKTRKRCLRLYKAFFSEKGTAQTVQDVTIVQPQTFMNNSGEIARFFDLSSQTVIVVCDNMDLEPGMIRIRKCQSISTHKGLRSIQQNTAGVEILAVYIGIGRPEPGVEVVDYVLSRPEGVKLDAFRDGAEKAALALEQLASGKSVQEVQLEFNHKQTEK